MIDLSEKGGYESAQKKILGDYFEHINPNRVRDKMLERLTLPQNQQLEDILFRNRFLYDPFSRYLKTGKKQKKQLQKEKSKAYDKFFSVFKRGKKLKERFADTATFIADSFLDPYREFANTDFAKRIFTKPKAKDFLFSSKEKKVLPPRKRRRIDPDMSLGDIFTDEVFLIPKNEQPISDLLREEQSKDRMDETSSDTMQTIVLTEAPLTLQKTPAIHRSKREKREKRWEKQQAKRKKHDDELARQNLARTYSWFEERELGKHLNPLKGVSIPKERRTTPKKRRTIPKKARNDIHPETVEPSPPPPPPPPPPPTKNASTLEWATTLPALLLWAQAYGSKNPKEENLDLSHFFDEEAKIEYIEKPQIVVEPSSSSSSI